MSSLKTVQGKALDLKRFFFDYGVRVPGYNVAVMNERETRAAAGIMFMLGLVVVFVAIGFNHTIVARVYLAFLFIDFTIRLFTPRYSPLLLLARFFVRNQIPEYVGGLQKRFAWTIGWLILIPLMQWFVLHWDISFYKVLLCLLCLALSFFESAFGICIGCYIYRWIVREEPQLCPGGACEIKRKDPVQQFTPMQALIASTTGIALIVGIYFFLAKSEPKTFFGEFLHEMVLTDQQLAAEKEAALDRQFEEDDFDDDF